MAKKRVGNPAMTGDALNLEQGDNAKILDLNMRLLNLPDINIRNAEQVSQRLGEYFQIFEEFDTKPTVSGMAIALGINRKTLWAIVNDGAVGGKGNVMTLPIQCAHTIKKAYNLLENMWEYYMLNGKINPVSGIFLAKNQFGYKDQTEVVIPQSQEQEVDTEEIRRRYLNGEQAKSLPESPPSVEIEQLEMEDENR